MAAQKPHIIAGIPLYKSILTKAACQQALFGCCIVLVLTAIAFLIAKGSLEQRVLAQLSSIVAAKEDLIEQSFQSDRERAALLASRSEMRTILVGAAGSPTLEKVLRQLHEEDVPAVGMTIWDRAEHPRATAGVQVDLPSVLTDRSVLEPLFGERGWHGHRVAVPITSSAGERIGTLAIHYDDTTLITSVLAVPSLGESIREPQRTVRFWISHSTGSPWRRGFTEGRRLSWSGCFCGLPHTSDVQLGACGQG